ncbi:hypothetical protein GGR21_002445 [Dysgonomonas hofstadii]|uniref:Holin n=1 Tax=Dysgonomonas hofstadii TaxID=637886 RepID=A0A840CPD2_9BACT|nr:phage holin family protein [Dysgonomonas hofstadii]MBB4036539.1 hypothetical protein [Dysgonomonas hofstadii]
MKENVVLFIQSYLNGDYVSLETKLAIVAIMWLFVAIAITLDLISGWRKAKERNEARTSYGLRRTVTKVVFYYAMMFFAFMFDCIGTFFYPLPYVTFIAAGFLIFIEGKSILEKAHDKDKRKLNNSLKDLSIMLDNRDDLIKGLTELVKKISEEKEVKNEKD